VPKSTKRSAAPAKKPKRSTAATKKMERTAAVAKKANRTTPPLKTTDVESIAERLTLAVESCEPRITRSKLAERLGVSPGAVSHYLNANRPCPDHILKKIATITKVEPGWIRTGDAGKQQPSQPSAVREKIARPLALAWGYRPAPADGGKDFGNAGVYATPATIETIVREDGQNSLDAGRGSEVTLRFRLIELSAQSKRYEKVVRRICFDQLERHVRAIDAAEFESKLGAKLTTGLQHIREERLLLLIVDDYGTHGLQGGEFDSTKPFSALVRDNLNSRKDSSTAGGIFGVGAKVNLACSRLSTVLFASKVEGQEGRGTRLIGRTEMTYHQLTEGRETKSFAGPGWLGDPGESGVTESVWLDDDDALLDDLLLRRDRLPAGVNPSDATGTSIMIVGFTDPQTESGASAQQLADHFIEAAAASFWPAMIRGKLAVRVEVYVDDAELPLKNENVDPRSIAALGELCDAWEKHITGETTPVLEQPGETASIPIPFDVPATRLGAKAIQHHDALEAEALLLVRLADPERTAGDPRVGHVAYVRGRSMVTRYQRRANVVGGRPFHAVVLAGTLVAKSHPQVAAEQFLRIAEPPAHDKWIYHSDVGEKYKRGGKKALDEFHARVTEELQRILKPVVSGNREGPEVLRKLLQIRRPKTVGPQQPVARILRSTSTVRDGAWHVHAEVSLNPVPRVLHLTPRLSFRCEGSAPIPVSWQEISVEDGGASVTGTVLVVPPRAKRLAFTGISDPGSHPVDATDSSATLDILARFGGES
jgi:transcriptional regulator with XRE-family HTH domain